MSDVSPQRLLAMQPDLCKLLDSYWESLEDSDVIDKQDVDFPAEVVAAFEENMQDMAKEDALEAMWGLVGDLLRGRNSVSVFWMMEGDRTIHRSNVAHVNGDKLEFDDGGWNLIADCFLTEEQCRKHHDLPPRVWKESCEILKERLKAFLDELSE